MGGMLDTSPENLFEEAAAAESHAKKHLASFPEMIQTYVGSYFREDMRPLTPAAENYPYSYVANVRPRLVFTNPRFNASSENTVLKSTQLVMQAKFVNRWAVQNCLQRRLVIGVTSALLMRATFLMTFDDEPQDAALPPTKLKRKMPHCHLLENHRYFRDPVSTPAVEPRYKGHVWVRDLEDVEKMPGVTKEVIANLIPDIELKKLQRPNDNHGSGGEMPPRFEILAYEIWVPECNDYATDPRCHHGTIFTVACGQSVSAKGDVKRYKKGYLRPPRPYYGPEWGPYIELEYVDVPGQTYGTSPVSVVMQQVEELNAHLAATADAAARMKHLCFVDAANDTLLIATQNSPDGSVIGIPNLNKEGVVQVLLGGPAPEQYQYNEVVRERLDRNIGMDAAQRGGQEAQDKTATASNIRYQSMNVRMADLKRITADVVKRIANTVAWYGWHSNNVVMRLSESDGEELGVRSPAYLGGPQDGEQLPDWDEAALELEPYSMEAVDEDKLAAEIMEALAIITQMAQEMQTAPWLGYDVILAQLGKLRKFDWLDECINGELFSAWMQEQVKQSLEVHQNEQALQQAQIEGQMIQNAKLRLEMALMMHEASQPVAGEERKGPSVSISYKDLPEDVKRQAEHAAGYKPSTMPLTSPAHVSNALAMHEGEQNRMHKGALQKSQQKHQVQQSRLSMMFKAGAQGKRGASGMRSKSDRAQNGPTQTARTGQRALASSR